MLLLQVCITFITIQNICIECYVCVFFPSPLTNCPISINNPFEKLLPEQAVFLCLCFYFSAVSEANEVLNKVDLQSPADSILGAGKKGFLSPLRQLKD